MGGSRVRTTTAPAGHSHRRMFRDSVLRALEIGESDSGALTALLLIHAVIDCKDVDQSLLQAVRWLPRAALKVCITCCPPLANGV